MIPVDGNGIASGLIGGYRFIDLPFRIKQGNGTFGKWLTRVFICYTSIDNSYIRIGNGRVFYKTIDVVISKSTLGIGSVGADKASSRLHIDTKGKIICITVDRLTHI